MEKKLIDLLKSFSRNNIEFDLTCLSDSYVITVSKFMDVQVLSLQGSLFTVLPLNGKRIKLVVYK